MRLTLEQILEEFPDKNFIVRQNPKYDLGEDISIPTASHNGQVTHCTIISQPKLIKLELLVNNPILNNHFWISEENAFLIEAKILDYSGDWRDSLRSREDIKPLGVSIGYDNAIDFLKECFECPDCKKTSIWNLENYRADYCPHCGIKLNWVE